MTVKTTPMYWAECDGEGCGRRNPDEESDFGGWGDEATLFDDDAENTWFKTPDGKTWCPHHAPGRADCGWCDGRGIFDTGVPMPPPYERLTRVETCAHCTGNGWIATPEPSGSQTEGADRG